MLSSLYLRQDPMAATALTLACDCTLEDLVFCLRMKRARGPWTVLPRGIRRGIRDFGDLDLTVF